MFQASYSGNIKHESCSTTGMYRGCFSLMTAVFRVETFKAIRAIRLLLQNNVHCCHLVVAKGFSQNPLFLHAFLLGFQRTFTNRLKKMAMNNKTGRKLAKTYHEPLAEKIGKLASEHINKYIVGASPLIHTDFFKESRHSEKKNVLLRYRRGNQISP